MHSIHDNTKTNQVSTPNAEPIKEKLLSVQHLSIQYQQQMLVHSILKYVLLGLLLFRHLLQLEF